MANGAEVGRLPQSELSNNASGFDERKSQNNKECLV